MRIEIIAGLWPYALAFVVLPFALFDLWRRRHAPKGQAARRAHMARQDEATRDRAWREAEASGEAPEEPPLATMDRE